MVSRAEVNHTFTDTELDELKAFGTTERHKAGDLLVEEGAMAPDCIVTLSGHTDIFASTDEGRKRVGWMEHGQFAGDLSVLTGQRHLSRVEMGAEGEILRIAHADFQRLIAGNSHFSDIFIRVLSARREFSKHRGFAVTIVIGAAMDRSVYAMRDLLMKHGVAHRWFDPADGPVAAHLLAERGLTEDQLPVAILGAAEVLVQPTPEQLAAGLGLDLLPDGATADVLVVGSGPGGLAAAVYAASEGLTVIALDSLAPGGQAGTSSKIENYLGFPTGISGQALAGRAQVQAQKFGARLLVSRSVAAIDCEGSPYAITLDDGAVIKARAVVVATGARYRKLDLERYAELENSGIYYAATAMEAGLCAGQVAVVVGGGNSAGQAAIFLARTVKHVHMLVRGAGLAETMSSYLIERIEASDRITLHPHSEVTELEGENHLEALTFTHKSGERQRHEVGALFVMIGAVPNTDWLGDCLELDSAGFVVTGQAGVPYAASKPGIFAVGDVRSGSVKRVASGVGEGSVVVSAIHQYLDTLA